MLTMTHFWEIDYDKSNYTVECECGWTSEKFDEEWQAEEAGWYHADYPDGE